MTMRDDYNVPAGFQGAFRRFLRFSSRFDELQEKLKVVGYAVPVEAIKDRSRMELAHADLWAVRTKLRTLTGNDYIRVPPCPEWLASYERITEQT